MNKIQTGDVLIRKSDYKVFYVSCCNWDGTYKLRHKDRTNKLFKLRASKKYIEEVFINESQQLLAAD